MRLNEVPLSDIYICANPEMGGNFALTWVKPKKGQSDLPLVPLSDDFDPEIAEIRAKLKASLEREFSIVHDGLRYRCAKIFDLNAPWFCLRRGAGMPPDLDKLGVDPRLVPSLMQIGRFYGLILITGAPGSGKTTLSSALLRRYLEVFGDVAITVEDPPEHPLSGFYGGGVCYQTAVENDEWENPIKAVFRYAARYLFVGEIRTPGAAAEALRAAMRGHVVMATLHAGNLQEALEVFLALAEQRAGISAPSLVAQCISAVFYLELDRGLKVQYVFAGHGLGDPLRSLLRMKMFEQVGTIIHQQKALMERGSFSVAV